MPGYHMFKAEKEIFDRTALMDILGKGRFTTIALCRDNEPYIVTLSYGYDTERNCLYFHTALKGAKLDFIREGGKVCATIIEDRGYKHGQCGHAYRSLVLSGTMTIVEGVEEKRHGFEVLLSHQEKDPEGPRAKFLPNEASYSGALILRLDIEELRGKEGH